MGMLYSLALFADGIHQPSGVYAEAVAVGVDLYAAEAMVFHIPAQHIQALFPVARRQDHEGNEHVRQLLANLENFLVAVLKSYATSQELRQPLSMPNFSYSFAMSYAVSLLWLNPYQDAPI